MLATVATFTDSWEAHIFRGRLLAENIFAVVSHEHHVGLTWPEALALGGVKVQVHRADREKALEVERRCRAGELQAELAATYADFYADFDASHCPQCGANRITHRRSLPMLAFLLYTAYVTGLIFPLRSSVHRCGACGAKWVDRSEPTAFPGPWAP